MVFAAGARVAEAQGGATASAGAIRYHMQGVEGTTWALAARFELPVRQYVIIEPSFTYFRWQPLAGSKVSYVIPELTFEVQGYLGRVHPYLGSGIGWASPTRGIPGVTQNYFSVHAAGGFRYYLSRRFGIRGEFRLRSIDPWHGYTADLTLGVIQVSGGRGM